VTAIAISFGSLRFSLRSASDIRDALLASFVDEAYAGGPFVMVGREDAQPAWLWAGEIIRTRSDWWQSVGLALQHAAHDGGDRERTALVDLLANERSSAVLLEWTEPLARRWPDARSTRSNTNWGGAQEARLVDVIRDQRKYLDNGASDEREVVIEENGKVRVFDLTSPAQLQDLLSSTATRGDRGGHPPWQWLTDEVLFRPWVPTALPGIVAGLTRDVEVCALLDWLSDGWDLWRFVAMLDGWRTTPPAWFAAPAKTKPPGWKRPVRPATWSSVKTLGDIALQLLTRARAAVAAPPNPNLPFLS